MESSGWICDTCHEIDFHELLRKPRSLDSPWDTSRDVEYPIRYAQNCIVCEILLPADLVDRESQKLVVKSWSYEAVQLDPYRDAHYFTIVAVDSDPKTNSFPQSYSNTVFCASSEVQNRGLCKPRVVQKAWDYVAVRSCLQTCLQCHDWRCNKKPSQVAGMNLIDTSTMRIVRRRPWSRWIALSYVWGSGCDALVGKISYHAGSRLPAKLPQTIEDAIAVTKLLWYRYLWIDEYCIDQSDSDHQSQQIGRMDEIYKGADLTIVAAAGENKTHGLPGVNSTKRKHIAAVRIGDITLLSNGPEPIDSMEKSEWFTRAWTFQEGYLSRRLLVFTQYQTSFYCSTSDWMEGLSGPGSEPPAKGHRHDSLITYLFAAGVRVINNHHLFADLVAQYTRRDMTFGSDALNAFRGVMNNIRSLQPSAYSLRGLPFFAQHDDTSTQSVDLLILTAISWYNRTEHSPMDRRPQFPSWTWAAWKRTAMSVPPGFRGKAILNCAQLMVSNDHYLELPEQWHMGHSNLQMELDMVTIIEFEAPVWPVDKFNYLDLASYSSEAAPNTCLDGAIFTEYGPDMAQGFYDDIVEHIRSGEWSLLLLGEYLSDRFPMRYFLYVMVVAWAEDGIRATRVCGFMVRYDYPEVVDEDGNVVRGQLNLTPAESMEWRRVRLQ